MAVTDTAVTRAWFNDHGWQLEPSDLRAALEERGADEDTVIELIDEGADRRRTAPPEPRPAASTDNGGPSRASRPAAAQHASPGRDRKAGGADVPPQDIEAEESVLGAMIRSANAIGNVRKHLADDGHEFYLPSHGQIYRAALAMHDRDVPVDAITLTDELDRAGQLAAAGGRVRLHELGGLVLATANAAHYAKIVAYKARLRDQQLLALRLSDAASAGGLPPELRDELMRFVERPDPAGPPPEAIDAGSFIFDEPQSLDEIRLWGDDTAIGWSAGEGLMLLGPDGVGKTTLGQQLTLARAGLRSHVLGMPVCPDPRRVLLIAADRPRQAARSLRRMVGDLERQDIADRVTVWQGPLPAMLNEDRTLLARLAQQFDAGTVVIDSLKDVAVDIAKDEAGGRIAAAFQHLIATGIELLVLHHPRKPEVGQHRPVRELSDAYGSRLIYGVMGSVVILWGQPGDTIVEMRHLKQPIDELGPYNLRHDHARGQTTIEKGTDILDLVLAAGTAGLTAVTAAQLLYEKEAPTKNEIDRTRAKLDRLSTKERVVKFPGKAGGKGGGAEQHATYVYNGPQDALA